MKHPKTTMCGILFALCIIGFLVTTEWSNICYDHATSPLRVHGLVTARRLFMAAMAMFAFLGHFWAADADKVKPKGE